MAPVGGPGANVLAQRPQRGSLHGLRGLHVWQFSGARSQLPRSQALIPWQCGDKADRSQLHPIVPISSPIINSMNSKCLIADNSFWRVSGSSIDLTSAV